MDGHMNSLVYLAVAYNSDDEEDEEEGASMGNTEEQGQGHAHREDPTAHARQQRPSGCPRLLQPQLDRSTPSHDVRHVHRRHPAQLDRGASRLLDELLAQPPGRGAERVVERPPVDPTACHRLHEVARRLRHLGKVTPGLLSSPLFVTHRHPLL